MKASADAKEPALATDIQSIRRQVELYTFQHDGRGPQHNNKGKFNKADFVKRLTERTDVDGKLNASGLCGPYLMEWPTNPFCAPAVATSIQFGTGTSPPRKGEHGWYVNKTTCLVSANSETGGESLDP